MPDFSENCYGELFSQEELRGVALAIREIQRQFLCLRAEDYEDLLQECLLHWLTVRQSYNPEKGVLLASYLHRVITNKLFSMVRLLHRAKRQGLNFPVSLEDELAVYAQDSYGRSELRIDFESALKDMSARQRRLCKLLGEEGLTIAQAGKRLKTPRTTLYTDLAQIKSIFRRGSFESEPTHKDCVRTVNFHLFQTLKQTVV